MQANDGTKHAPQNLDTTLLRNLSSAVNGHAATATFACGGSIPISDLPTSDFGSGKQNIFPSVTIRWDANQNEKSTLSFPLHQHDDVSRIRFQDLLRRCQRATFGRGGQDVLDETYRKAGKLDITAFSTNFYPHDCGIVDSIQQVLLPSTIKGGQGAGIGPQGVRVELYKLNVLMSRECFSVPTLIRDTRSILRPLANSFLMLTRLEELRNSAHSWCAYRVSTKVNHPFNQPSSDARRILGVIMLTGKSTGGTLRVRHRGQTMDFAWASTSPKNLQWAAFYGDCEHEVLEVTRGHRITLTYNLH